MSHQANTARKQERRFMNEEETAAVIRTSRKSLQNMRYRGEGPPYHKLGAGQKARVVYDYDEVMAWMDRNKVVPGKPQGGK